MQGNLEAVVAQSIAITDPGEIDREAQSKSDRLIIWVSNLCAWIFPILMLAICTQVVIRKMGMNQAWLDDAQWWLYGFAMTVGFAYAITTQSHVRVDILHQNFSPEKKARVEVFGLGWLLLPFLVMMVDIMFHYGWSSVLAQEGSDSPNGLHRLYLLKMSLPVIFVLATIATISMMIRHLRVIRPIWLWSVLWGMFPAAWFMAERLTFYIAWWYIRLTDAEIVPRRITREPIMEYTIWIGLGLILIVMAVSYMRRNRSEAI